MATPPASDEALARASWLRIRSLVAAPDLVAAEHRFMHEVGLPAGPLRALRALLDGGPGPMKLLAQRLGCDKSYVTGLLRPLLARELVTLEPDPGDGRVKVVHLTPEGTALAQRARQVHETPPEAITRLGHRELDALATLLESTRTSA